MGQSLIKNYLHIVFSTKYREALIFPPHEQELHAYLGGICKKFECYPVRIGGYTDHVHILCLLSKKITLMKLLQELKSNSSRWMKTKDKSLLNFCWQDGYGAFSVNYQSIDVVSNYIINQHDHHKKQDFKSELREILEKHNVRYDERFVWE